jgi:hypothetical protein
MLYKTIVLELLEAQPTLHKRLRLSRKLLTELERYANTLKTAHQQWTEAGLDSSGAMEKAVHEIEERIAQEAARFET